MLLEAKKEPAVLVIPGGNDASPLRAALRSRGFRIIVPPDVGEALAVVADVAADSVLIEVEEGAQAAQFVAEVQRRVGATGAPLVVTAAADVPGDVVAALFARGVADVFLPTVHPALAAAKMAALVELKHRVDQARELSVRDELTGLYNRRFFGERLEQEVARSRRTGFGLGLVLFDVDRFKKINDTFGHPAGDAVLRVIAATASAHTRKSDLVARVGGDEFALLLAANSREGARVCAEALVARLREAAYAFALADGGLETLAVTVSAGVAWFPSPSVRDPPLDLVRLADAALLRAKAAGRDRALTAEE